MNSILFVSLLISFFLCLYALPRWIEKCKHIGLLWEDMNKFNHPKTVAASGGVVVIFAFILGVLSYIALRTFILQIDGVNVKIFALLNVILILGIVGLVDDLMGWKHGGLSTRFRLFFAFVASIPLVVIDAGIHDIFIPSVGLVELGIIYPLIIIPLGIA